MALKPLNQIKLELSDKIPNKYIQFLPTKWEKIGDILIIKISEELKEHKKTIAKVYSDVLNCRSVINDKGGITGELRKPDVELIYGSKDTETVHIENKVRFKIDPMKLMFSKGNMDERLFMSRINVENETVVDMFAGIGYFSLPIAVHSKPKKIFACEKNPDAYFYLSKNVLLNKVIEIVEPIKGDNRKVAPQNVADRIIMGYIGGTEKYIETALKCLKENKGIIHFHEKYPQEIRSEKIVKIVKEKSKRFNREVKLLEKRKIKSYAPGIFHFVFDFEIL